MIGLAGMLPASTPLFQGKPTAPGEFIVPTHSINILMTFYILVTGTASARHCEFVDSCVWNVFPTLPVTTLGTGLKINLSSSWNPR